MFTARPFRNGLSPGSLAAAGAAGLLVACSTSTPTSAGYPAIPSPPPPSASAATVAAELTPVATMLTSVSGDRTFTALALISQQLRQLRTLTTQSDDQLKVIKAARAQPPLSCAKLAGYASAAAGLAGQDGPLLQAIPGELQTLSGEIGPTGTRVAALQRRINQLSTQAQQSTDAAVTEQISAYLTAAGVLAQTLKNAQTSLGTIPAELDRFQKQYAAAGSSPIEVSNLGRPQAKRRTS